MNSSSTGIPSSFNAAASMKRKQIDIAKLLVSDYKVIQGSNNPFDLTIEFYGPQDTLYEGGQWNVHVYLPDQYPYKSPSIGFVNQIFHPNIDEASGSVCLDVINQTWSPMYNLINIFDIFLPQLLSYPNPTDPLNPEAASLLLKEESKYKAKVRDYMIKYGSFVPKVEQTLSNKSTEESISPVATTNPISGKLKFSEESKDLENCAKQLDLIPAELDQNQINQNAMDEELSNISDSELSQLSQTSNLQMDDMTHY